MSSFVFSAGKNLLAAPEGAVRVQLEATLFVIRGTYEDPISGDRRPLPPHYWQLYSTESPRDRVVLGKASDKEGRATIPVKPILLEDDTELWALIVAPLKKADREGMAQHHEMWIDLEKNEWVPPKLVRQMDADGLAARKRKLLRLPFMGSSTKAVRGRHFDGPTADFKFSGLWHGGRDVTPYGTLDAPWEYHLDHHWLRTRVRMIYYNWVSKAEETVPPGLLVDAVSPGGTVLGAGTAVDEKGVFVLHALTAFQATGEHRFHYRVFQNESTYVALDKATVPGAPELVTGHVPRKRDTRYTLPGMFHSAGWETWFLASGPKTRTRWEDFREKEDLTNGTVVFHLDDLVLVEANGLVETKIQKGSRITVFDQYLKVREPSLTGLSHSGDPIDENYLHGDRATFTAGEGYEKTTRILHFEGQFHDVTDKRVRPGATRAVGARAALRDNHPHIDMRAQGQMPYWAPYEVRLLDTPVAYQYDGAPAELVHLLIVCTNAVKPDTGVHFNPLEFQILTLASEMRWSANHPAFEAQKASNKDYALVPRGSSAASPPKRVVRARFFFGAVPAGKEMITIIVQAKIPWPTGNGPPAYVVTSPKPGEMRIKSDYTLLSSFGYGDVAADSDGIPFFDFMLNHEMGHAMALWDEYAAASVAPETARPKMSLLLLLRFSQAFLVERPYLMDFFAIMQGGCLPRLRYLWHFLQAARQSSSIRDALGETFVPEYRKLGLTYELDPAAVRWDVALFSTRIGQSTAVLYPVGDDEYTAEYIFAYSVASLTGPYRFQGLLVLRTSFLFDADLSAVAEDDVWLAMDALMQSLYQGLPQPKPTPAGWVPGKLGRMLPKLPMWILPKPGVALSRIPRMYVLFEPHFERAPNKSPVPADLTVRIVAQKGSLWSAVKQGDTSVSLTVADMDHRLIRLALGLDPNASPSVDPADLSPIAAAVGQFLGDPAQPDGLPARVGSMAP